MKQVIHHEVDTTGEHAYARHDFSLDYKTFMHFLPHRLSQKSRFHEQCTQSQHRKLDKVCQKKLDKVLSPIPSSSQGSL